MEEEPVPNSPTSSPSTSQSPSSSSTSSQVQEEEGEENDQEEEHHQLLERNLLTPFGELTTSSDDTRSCIVVLLTFWFFASITLIMGFYGASNLQLGPNCSHLLHVSSWLVNRIKEWVYYLNEGSQLKIDYTVRSKKSSPLSLVIAQGKDSFVEWIDDLSRPNPTLSWNIIYGSGMVQQKIFKPSYYYVALGNLNPEDVKVKLRFKIHAILYNTSEAHSKCSLAHGVCGFKLFFLGSNAAVLTSPAPEKHRTSDWYVSLSYEPRWISYFAGSGAMTILMVLGIKLCNKAQSTRLAGVGFQPGERIPDRTPFLAPKEDGASSLGSSYESVSHDEEDAEDLSPETKGDTNHLRRVCVICFDAPRDCFFLPCGHCASCFTCGTRIVEEAGTCPICRRKMKKVRKIFTV